MSILQATFHPASVEVQDSVPAPKPAVKTMPQWYRNMERHVGGEYRPGIDGETNATAKACVPFADAMRNGWVQETWQDIHVDSSDGTLRWQEDGNGPEMLSQRDYPSTPIPNGYGPEEMSFALPWAVQLPQGWSVLVVSPMNRYLPILSYAGLIEADSFFDFTSGSSFPFYFRTGFSGTIPAGTPFAQFVPVKRERWGSSIAPYRTGIISRLVTAFGTGGYQKVSWSRKVFR